MRPAEAPAALPFVVAVCGHRDLHGADLDCVRARLAEALELIAAALPHSPIHVLSALADGADQLAAEQVLALQRRQAASGAARRIELIVPLPLPFDAYCDEQAGGAAARLRDPAGYVAARQAFVARFLRYSAAASKVFVIAEPAAGEAGAGLTVAQAAYVGLNRYLAIHAQLLLAVWDGQDEAGQFPRRPGGTLDLVLTLLHGLARRSHARSSNRFAEPVRGAVLHIYSRRARPSSAALPPASTVPTVRLAWPGPAGTVAQLAAPRPHWPGVRAPGLASFGSRPIQASERWAAWRAWRALTARVQARLGRRLAGAELAALYRIRAAGLEIDLLNRAHQRALAQRGDAYAGALQASAGGFLSGLGLPAVAALPAGLGLGLGALLHSFSAVDVLATRTRRHWLLRWLFLASAAVLASASSTLRLFSPAHGDLIESLAFSAGAFCAVGTYLWVALSNQRNAYLDYRALAEGLRCQMYWLCAGQSTLASDHYVQKYSGEAGWVRRALDACMVVHPPAGLPALTVLRGWIADQTGYLDGAGNRRRQRRHGRAVALGNNMLLGGLMLALAALATVLASGRHYALLLALLIAGMKLSTGVGAAWLSLNSKLGHGETLMQLEHLRGVYGRAGLELASIEAAPLAVAEKEQLARDLLYALGKAVLDENASWLAAFQQRRLSWHGR